MKKSILFGISLFLLTLVYSLVQKDIYFLLKVSGVIGSGAIIVAGLITGVFQERVAPGENYSLEDKNVRNTKTKWSLIVFVFGLPFIFTLVLALIIFSFN
ncbi:hypothetical protein JI667_07095 [Bacillus sp. NTK074B]|uniref:DUF5316 family protein n=1 Tax=Bacillus sp. NTK074B TaxID=2802174 RepID=UPI001A8D48F2|nr:hypothetical protein [Bacillus sp. NTK074B]